MHADQFKSCFEDIRHPLRTVSDTPNARYIELLTICQDTLLPMKLEQLEHGIRELSC